VTEPRRQFRLSESDEAFLDHLGFWWETLIDAQLRWLVIREFLLPAGYNRGTASVAIIIAPGYPPGPLDMAYFHPWLSRVDSRPIPCANTAQMIDGLSWQRWSRHRTAENPWIEGEDDLASHFHYMESWLANELQRT
jgi:hypothetical protein